MLLVNTIILTQNLSGAQAPTTNNGVLEPTEYY